MYEVFDVNTSYEVFMYKKWITIIISTILLDFLILIINSRVDFDLELVDRVFLIGLLLTIIGSFMYPPTYSFITNSINSKSDREKSVYLINKQEIVSTETSLIWNIVSLRILITGGSLLCIAILSLWIPLVSKLIKLDFLQ